MNMVYYLTAYVVVMGLFIFICLFGHSRRWEGTIVGRLNDFLTTGWIELTKKILHKLAGGYGERLFNWVEMFCCERANPIIMYFYICLVVGGYWGYIHYVYEYVTPENGVSEFHKIIGYFVVGCTFGSFLLAARSDPGRVTKENIGFVNEAYPHDNIIFRKTKHCNTCDVDRPARSRHCRMCGYCISKNDHHCVWINQCVGERNYRWFLLFLTMNMIMCAYATIVTVTIIRSFLDRSGIWRATYRDSTGIRVPVGYMFAVQYVMALHGPQFFFIILCGIMGFVLLAFIVYHLSMASRNVTTIETYKFQELKEYLIEEPDKLQNVGQPPEEASDSQSSRAGGRKKRAISERPDKQLLPHSKDAKRIINKLVINKYNLGIINNLHQVMFPPSIELEKKEKARKQK